MSQKEKTVQPSREEVAQNEPYQKTRDLAQDQINRQVVDSVNSNPSIENKDAALEATESDIEKELHEVEAASNEQLEAVIEAGKTPEAQEKVAEADALKADQSTQASINSNIQPIEPETNSPAADEKPTTSEKKN